MKNLNLMRVILPFGIILFQKINIKNYQKKFKVFRKSQNKLKYKLDKIQIKQVLLFLYNKV